MINGITGEVIQKANFFNPATFPRYSFSTGPMNLYYVTILGN